ncbi:MAG: hypothetical protein IT174_14185 [Acidobacteria bacterium]|nr:hypothetical protein [Acidobacteriota bacterium]
MAEKNIPNKDAPRSPEHGAEGKFYHNKDRRSGSTSEPNEGRSQGGNGLSQKRDRMEKVSRDSGAGGQRSE